MEKYIKKFNQIVDNSTKDLKISMLERDIIYLKKDIEIYKELIEYYKNQSKNKNYGSKN